MDGSGLPAAWDGLPAWCVLDTAWGDGHRFLATWQAWHRDTHRPRLLHYVAICPQAPDVEELRQTLVQFPDLQPHADAFLNQWFGLLPGFHRLVAGNGHVLLTLCIGDLVTLLREQRLAADAVFLGGLHNLWTLKAVARCCRRGTSFATDSASAGFRHDLLQCGFDILHGQFNPRWDLKNSRGGRPAAARTPGNCVVIGAGLAGASVAACLARRGWQVQVLDAASTPAAGASGLPVGLAVPHHSPDDSPRSRLSRAGLRLTLQQARQLLQWGADFDDSGVLEHRFDGATGLPANWPEAGRDWSHEASTASLWHPHAAWIKPARLVQAWLSQPGIRVRLNARVQAITRSANQSTPGWVLHSDTDDILASAPLLILATAGGTLQVLGGIAQAASHRLASLHEISGQVSWGLHREGDAAVFHGFAVNGSGSFIPAVPTPEGLAWFAGATYALQGEPLSIQAQQADNLTRLNRLLPDTGAWLAPRLVSGPSWTGRRCATSDRLPVVGPVPGADGSVCVSTGMGSRGLSFSVLCAELLAAHLSAEPLPVEASLARLLSPE